MEYTQEQHEQARRNLITILIVNHGFTKEEAEKKADEVQNRVKLSLKKD